MIKRIAVGDIMTRNLVTVRPNTDLKICAKELIKQRINTLLVTEKDHLLGILTSRDILWALMKKPGLDLKDVKVLDIATKKIAVTKPSADISQAFKKMKKCGFRRLPVISKGNLVGMLTLKDILKVDPLMYQEVGRLAEVKEEEQKLKRITGKEDFEVEGLCEVCDSFESLTRVDGKLICRYCIEEMA